jgi:hypothetical protein
LQAAAEFSGRDLLMDRGKEVDAGSLGLGKGEQRKSVFTEGELGTADHDPLSKR